MNDDTVMWFLLLYILYDNFWFDDCGNFCTYDPDCYDFYTTFCGC